MLNTLRPHRCRNFRLMFCICDIWKSSFQSASSLNYSSQNFTTNDHSYKLPPPVSSTNAGQFFQVAPELGNQYTQDVFARRCLQRVIPEQILDSITPDLERFGQRISEEINQFGISVEQKPPYLEQHDAWGKRIDRIVTSDAWQKLHDVSATEGLIAIGYERKQEQWSRLYQIMKMYLFAPSSGLYSCPLAMTDGAAKVIEMSEFKDEPWLKNAYQRLISRDPKRFWTSGQWMTERKGGSDVANGTETIARKQRDGSYKLYGYKWFSSATDSNMSITLARVQKTDGSLVQGTKGLSLFYLETRDEEGRLNNIEVQRLKNKLGTKQLPTAELILDGTQAYKISEEGRGVPEIAHMLTITRVLNTVMAVSNMRRMVNLARDYSTKRSAFNKKLCEHPLHVQTLARMEVEVRGAFCLLMEISSLLGLNECALSTDNDVHLLRLLTPITKLYTAKQAMQITSEGLECFGGQGYIEDTGLPTLFRDSQVLPIWEGTTNILSLDVLRSILKSEGKVLLAFSSAVQSKLSQASSVTRLDESCSNVHTALKNTLQFTEEVAAKPHFMELAARDLAYSLARIYIGSLLIEHAAWKNAEKMDIEVAQRWCQQDLQLVVTNNNRNCYDKTCVENDLAIVMTGHPGYNQK